MALVYREDPDLEILKNCTNEELEVLETILIKDDNGNYRKGEKLTSEERYKSQYPNRRGYWDLIAAEYQRLGENFSTQLSLVPPIIIDAPFLGFASNSSYSYLLSIIAEKLGVKKDKNTALEFIEINVLKNFLSKALKEGGKNNEEIENLLSELEQEENYNQKLGILIANNIAKKKVGKNLDFSHLEGGIESIGMGCIAPLPFPLNFLFSVLTMLFISVKKSKAKQIIIPATIYIASLRQIYLNKEYLNKEN